MRPSRARVRQWEIALPTFSPREIQSRVRAGASAEDVADDTGWPLDKVLRYAEPLLAERAFIAEQALAVEVRRSHGGATLRQAAAAATGTPVDSDAITWDAWRREDGKWVVSANFTDRGKKRKALWTYDHSGRNIHPLDDSARTLMGVRGVSDDADAIADALDLVAEPEPEPRPRLVAVPDADTESEPEEPAASSTADTVTIPHSAPDAGKPAAKPKSRKGRAHVPSWDEILFGATRPDDQP